MHYSDHQDLEGMTVNERLQHFGLIEAFGEAIRAKNGELAISVMERARFTHDQANFTVTTILAEPSRFGY